MDDKLINRIIRRTGLQVEDTGFYEGADCRYIRQEAAENLPEAIESERRAGAKIAPAHAGISEAVKVVALLGEKDGMTLTKTWDAMTEALRAHILVAGLPVDEQSKYLDRMALNIECRHVPAHVALPMCDKLEIDLPTPAAG